MMERKVVKHANRARGREKSVRRGRLKKAEIEDMKMRGVESYEVGYRRSKEGVEYMEIFIFLLDI